MFQKGADDGARQDDDADIADGSAEAVVDRLDNVRERQSGKYAEAERGDQECQKRM